MPKKFDTTLGCMMCGCGFPERELTRVPLPQPSWDARICKGCRACVQDLEDPAGSAGKRLRLRIAVAGVDRGDLVGGLEEVLRHVKEDFLSGHGGHDTGAFVFDIIEKG